jgi:hypothetical protein
MSISDLQRTPSGSVSPIQRHKALREDAHAHITRGLDAESLGPANRAAALRQYEIGAQKINEALNVTFADEADRSVVDGLPMVEEEDLKLRVPGSRLERAMNR